jgi:hypothetical protein
MVLAAMERVKMAVLWGWSASEALAGPGNADFLQSNLLHCDSNTPEEVLSGAPFPKRKPAFLLRQCRTDTQTTTWSAEMDIKITNLPNPNYAEAKNALRKILLLRAIQV